MPFDLAPPPNLPLDLGGGPQQSQPAHDKREWLKLAILMGAAAKAGPDAVRGVLQGWQQNQVQQHGFQHQQFQDQLAQQRLMSEDAQRRNTLQQQELARKSEFLNRFTTGLNGLDDPAAIDAYLKLHEAQAGSFGVQPTQLQEYVQSAMPPSTQQRKAAEKKINALKSQFGADWMEQAQKFQHVVNGEQISFQELLKRGGMIEDPNAPPTPPKAETRGLDVQAADALARGDTATYQRLKQVADEMSGARRADKDPVLGELQQLRLEQARNAATQTPNLPPRVQQAVTSQSKGWDSLPIVKNVQKQAEAVSFTDEMKKDPGNPANDIGLIYAFAKAMDPDSVVREGEYATVQKYAQTWAQTFGFNAQRIFSNVPFLSDEARANMARTIRSKYQVGRKQYDAVRKSYAAKIDKLTGGSDGEQYLTDYAGGFPQDTQQPNTNGAPGVTRPAGPNPFRRGNAR